MVSGPSRPNNLPLFNDDKQYKFCHKIEKISMIMSYVNISEHVCVCEKLVQIPSEFHILNA